ncbi:putative lipoprotein [Oceaniovalibus guishaninsula JLT2003]|uniref:Putative lipoprotein n=1 Tax=Oceaniovalibus guishaninsula JLT2003 TaxID=1231392 RepID=K2HJN8_9RHOB|nr:BMP family ABC transporter substrate-binding protein [Oceaniovalibus guishaninsula]EKE43209.1 putative lipoprotein [Oceaniovalibus guishaninsula JLT2003]
MILDRCIAAATLTAGLGVAGAFAQDRTFYYVSPDPIGLNPFLQMGEAGIRAAADAHDAGAVVIESDTPQSRLENVSAAANDGADIVVVLGFEFSDILRDIAPLYPDTQFLIVDQCIWDDRPDNISCAVFREHESAFLMGAVAGLASQADKVAVVSAIDIPFLHRYTDAFAAGARHVAPDTQSEVRWVGGQNPFADPVRAKEQALALAAGGADVIFSATAGGDFGVFEAAQEQGFTVTTVDVNHCPAAPGRILDGTLKRVDEVIGTSIDRILAGERSFVATYGLAEGGMGAISLLPDAELAESGCLVADRPEIVAQVRDLAAQIVDGSLTVADPMAAD